MMVLYYYLIYDILEILFMFYNNLANKHNAVCHYLLLLISWNGGLSYMPRLATPSKRVYAVVMRIQNTRVQIQRPSFGN